MPEETPPLVPPPEQPRTEEGQLLPVDQVTYQPPPGYVPPDSGQPAREHLNSKGTFETVNPAGTVVRQDGIQVDVGTEVPPSLEKLREGIPTDQSLGDDPSGSTQS